MIKILFQGDSITDVRRNKEEPTAPNGMGSGYPLLLKARLNYEKPGKYEIRNLGISGNRVVDLYARMQRDILNIRPDILSILLGVNDVWHGLREDPNGVSADKFERIYDWMIREIQEALPATKIMILEPFVLPGRATQVEEDPSKWAGFSTEVPLRAAAAKRVAEKNGNVFVPLQKVLDDACRLAPPSHWLFDGVHPTEAGHELIAREWLKAFKNL